MEFKDFGLKLARVRMSKGISAYELSLRIGHAPNYIHQVETGKNNLSLRAILAICEALEIEPKDLF